IDQLLFDELLTVPDAVKDFADGDRRDGMLANKTETCLILCRRRIFHPEHPVRFYALTKTRRFYRRQAVMHVMQKVLVKTKFTAHGFKEFWREIEVLFRGP